jgi:gas vesicle protein
MSDDRGTLGTNLLFFLLGAAAGAVVVALTTPKKGPELREDVKDLVGRLKRRVREARSAVEPEEPGEGETGG